MKLNLIVTMAASLVAVTLYVLAIFVQWPNDTLDQSNYEATNASQTSSVVTKITVEPDVHDFLLVKQNDTLTANFTIKNLSVCPIEITQVSKSCSCSDATLSSRNIPVDGEITMTVVWQTRDRVGPTEVPVQIAYEQQRGVGYGVTRCAIRGTV